MGGMEERRGDGSQGRAKAARENSQVTLLNSISNGWTLSDKAAFLLTRQHLL